VDVLLTDADIVTMAAGAGPVRSMLVTRGHENKHRPVSLW